MRKFVRNSTSLLTTTNAVMLKCLLLWKNDCYRATTGYRAQGTLHSWWRTAVHIRWRNLWYPCTKNDNIWIHNNTTAHLHLHLQHSKSTPQIRSTTFASNSTESLTTTKSTPTTSPESSKTSQNTPITSVESLTSITRIQTPISHTSITTKITQATVTESITKTSIPETSKESKTTTSSNIPTTSPKHQKHRLISPAYQRMHTHNNKF